MVLSISWLLSLKVLLMSIGVLTMVSIPLGLDFSASQAPVLWASLLSWLKPPYLYLIINGIIIGIIVSSRFYQNDEVSKESSSSPPDHTDYGDMKIKSEFGGMVYEQQEQKVEMETEAPVFEEKSAVVSAAGSVEVGYGDATWTPPERTRSSDIHPENTDIYQIPEFDLSAEKEKPLVSAQFDHWKPVKAGPKGGMALRVTTPERHATLENTWKAITEGRPMPLTRHLKISDTWENHGLQVNVDPSPVKMSETFKDRTNYQLPPLSNSPASSGKLREELSLSQDELNHRVEAFIKKFNDEMRLQKQESLNAGKLRKEPSLSQDELNRRAEAFINKVNDEMRLQRQESLNAGKLRKEKSLNQDELNSRAEAFIKKFNEEMRLQRQESLKQYQEMISRGI